MCLSALLIFIYSLKISEWVQSGRLGGPPPLRRRAQGELPEGQEKVPRGDNSVAQLVRLVAADGTCEFYLMMNVLPQGATR